MALLIRPAHKFGYAETRRSLRATENPVPADEMAPSPLRSLSGIDHLQKRTARARVIIPVPTGTDSILARTEIRPYLDPGCPTSEPASFRTGGIGQTAKKPRGTGLF
jgi:hypothetical protein